ncbi:Hypothetical predicted protein [Olea europaea subsp. europaea]|uniref:Uncharacterized protein n=1 Tax=Olea europaea subsp. europaea TaxID=158383 RepID=A0A8S0S212_OLEEU|nr:Hypothetical predicted protein [Olea europaea subsp. europaea]
MTLETELLPVFTAIEGDYNSDDNVAAAEKDGIHELSKSSNCKPATNICVVRHHKRYYTSLTI